MFADYHVHTEFSDDSVYPMEDVIRDAVEMGMGEICITDHVDYGVKKDWDQGEISYRNGEPLANVDYPGYMEKIRQMKETWGDKIRIRTGMEFGVQRHTIPEFDFFTDILLTLLSCPYIRWKTRSSGPRIFREGRLRRSIIWDIMRNF